jgi:hypothetical protein
VVNNRTPKEDKVKKEIKRHFDRKQRWVYGGDNIMQ